MVSHAATATTHPTDQQHRHARPARPDPSLTLGYLVACWLFPFGHCRRCDGSGKRPSPSGRTFRLCRRCDGTGRACASGATS